jgi:hypothetical protein
LVPCVDQAPGFSIETGEGLGQITHSFQPQIPYRLSLSFLKHEVLRDGDPRQLRRPLHRRLRAGQ